MDKKLTDNEIVKALDCCIKSSHFGECFKNQCPLVSKKGCKVGKETLYLCGTEYITICLVTNFFCLINFIINPYTPLSSYVYTCILLFVGIKIVIPFLKSALKKIKS